MGKGLQKAGFYVDISYTGLAGEELALVNEYDTILLDLNLPDKDGIEILKYLRSENVATPIIIVTARDEIEERAIGLDLGADDYLTKPFRFLELRARIQAVIRRSHGRATPDIVIENLIISPIARTAKINGVNLELAAKEFDILEYIASLTPKVVSSEEIAEHIYDESFDPFSSVLRVHLMRLRKKLCQVAGYDVLITMRGKGYYLCVK